MRKTDLSAEGESRRVELLDSLMDARFRHRPLTWRTATLARASGSEQIAVPAGRFEVERRTVETPAKSWTFWTEKAAPHRIIRWETSDGETGELRGSERMKYWVLSGNGNEKELERVGLNAPSFGGP